jgi:hypothetical protein
VLGWHDLAAATQRLAEAQGAKSVLTDNREVTGELVYYLRDTTLPITIWFRAQTPRNHFEMTRSFTEAAPEPVLYVTLIHTRTSVPKRFDTSQPVGKQEFPTDALPVREALFYLLKGYEGDNAD